MNTSTPALFLSLIIGAVGAGLFVFGWKQRRWPQLAGGVILSAYPYFVPSVWLMVLIAVAVCAAVWLALRAGW